MSFLSFIKSFDMLTFQNNSWYVVIKESDHEWKWLVYFKDNTNYFCYNWLVLRQSSD